MGLQDADDAAAATGEAAEAAEAADGSSDETNAYQRLEGEASAQANTETEGLTRNCDHEETLHATPLIVTLPTVAPNITPSAEIEKKPEIKEKKRTPLMRTSEAAARRVCREATCGVLRLSTKAVAEALAGW